MCIRDRPSTSMAFLGPNDILVLEKETGTVQRITDGKMLPQPLLQVPVSPTNERGMLGIAVAKHNNGPTYVFLYYTTCLLYTSDAADERSSVDLGGRRIIKKKT